MTLASPSYFNVHGQLLETSWDEVFAAANRIRKFFDKLRERFPGRGDLITKIMYAMMSRHHVLLIGPHGTAKTLIFDTVLDSIQGAEVWKDQMTKVTKPDSIFGPYNVKAWRETGRPEHIIEGTLSTANFARIGEFFDASDMTLRAMLSALNERVVRLDLQVVRPPLMTVLADTNFRLEDEPDRVRQLAALVDRFLFQVVIDYLEDPADRIRMFTSALGNVYITSPGELAMADLELVSGLVHAENLIVDSYVVSAYEEATREFRQGQRGRNEILISDRRLIQAAIVMEVHALLRGNREVDFEDVDEARLVICGTRSEHSEFFDGRVPAIVQDWIQKAGNQAVEAGRAKITAIINSIPELEVAAAEDEAVLTAHIGAITSVLETLRKHSPQQAVLSSELIGHITAVEQRLDQVQQRLLTILERGVPTEEQVSQINIQEPGQIEKLHLMNQTLARLQEITGKLQSASDQVRATQHKLLDRIMRVRAVVATTSGFRWES
jgi:MoxR-like ATPase